MRFTQMIEGLRQWRGWVPKRRRAWMIGRTEVADARWIGDAERAAGEVPEGCAWLDERTVEDVDLSLLLARAGYPASIVADAERRAGASTGPAGLPGALQRS